MTERRALSAQLYLDGHTLAEIGAKLGVHTSAICRDIKAARQVWREDAADAVESMVAEQLQKIDAVERRAMRAWERSTEDKEIVTQKVDAEGKREVTKRTEGQAGCPAFLGIQLDCIEQRRKILGIDAPQRSEISGPAGGPIAIVRADQISDDELARIATGGGGDPAAAENCPPEPAGLRDVHEAGLRGELAPPAPVQLPGPDGGRGDL